MGRGEVAVPGPMDEPMIGGHLRIAGSSDLSVGWASRQRGRVGAGEGGRGPQESGLPHRL